MEEKAYDIKVLNAAVDGAASAQKITSATIGLTDWRRATLAYIRRVKKKEMGNVATRKCETSAGAAVIIIAVAFSCLLHWATETDGVAGCYRSWSTIA